ncbi:MAG: alpha/beta hydrolase, partial [Burkholderiales bacterium]|nr:alpha/beta hydrolase [Burkholderiales bacterium]
CGAAIPAARYRRFAAYLAASGVPALVYDYRGIGLSRPRALRGFRASIEDWAEHDCGGAIAWMRSRFPNAEMIGVAHSIGALLAGGAPNSGDQDRLVLVGGHTGYYGDYHPRYRVPMTAVWHALMPAITLLFGYFPARRLGLGEDIPARIALQWASRRSPDLRPSDIGPGFARVQTLLDRCAALQRPALIVSISDDAFATEGGVKRLLSYYPRLFPLERVMYTPADAGTRRIGHFGLFGRRAGAALWPRLLAQLEPSPN